MASNITLRTDGPHSPQYRAEVEDALAECARVLCYATRESAGGLVSPADADRLLDALCAAAGMLPQLLTQVSAFLAVKAASGRLGDDSGRDPEVLADAAALHLEVASARFAEATRALEKAQQIVSGLSVKGDGDA